LLPVFQPSDAESVDHCIEYGGQPTRTLFEGVFQVPPGHYLIATDKHFQLHQYWDFNYPKTNGHVSLRADADYAAEFRHALEEAVRIRLRADVPWGAFLSGGVDSSTIVGLMARHVAQPVKTF
jgi:asparagine synthase (glutamine-hydrolysing)